MVEKNHGKPWLVDVQENGTLMLLEIGRLPSLNLPRVTELLT